MYVISAHIKRFARKIGVSNDIMVLGRGEMMQSPHDSVQFIKGLMVLYTQHFNKV